MTVWKTIDSAPKDGSYVIAARFGRDKELLWVKHSRWITAQEIAGTYGDDPDDVEAGWTDGNDDYEPIYPTHWMELLPPPPDNTDV